jgi:hypothetical protein
MTKPVPSRRRCWPICSFHLNSNPLFCLQQSKIHPTFCRVCLIGLSGLSAQKLKFANQPLTLAVRFRHLTHNATNNRRTDRPIQQLAHHVMDGECLALQSHSAVQLIQRHTTKQHKPTFGYLKDKHFRFFRQARHDGFFSVGLESAGCSLLLLLFCRLLSLSLLVLFHQLFHTLFRTQCFVNGLLPLLRQCFDFPAD